MANEVFHLTRARSEPCHRTRGAASARGRRPFSTFGLVSARESGRTGGAGFSPADRAYVGSRHIPTKGPWSVDEVDSEAYVSQFSADGSLLVAGFRGSRIRVYNADRGWTIHKDINCRSLQWTVSDIALSPDQQFLVSILSIEFLLDWILDLLLLCLGNFVMCFISQTTIYRRYCIK